MRKVSECNRVLLVDVGDEGALVVHLEGEDTVLIWGLEGGAVDGGGRGGGRGEEREAVVGVEHGEFELELVRRGHGERLPSVGRPFGELDFEGL